MSIKNKILSKLRFSRYKNVTYPLINGDLEPFKITYLCQNTRKPSGGAKVIYKHTSIINTLFGEIATAQILHANQTSFRCDWDFDNLRFKADYHFDSNNEVFMLHEMWAVRESKVLIQKKIRYGVFVQGSYLINRKASFSEVKAAYENAFVIVCVSDDIYDCLTYLFPHLKQKIFKITLSIDHNVFNPAGHKKDLITYMPRRLKRHSDLVLFFLEAYLPSGWEVRPIDGMSQSEVAKSLGESKIFLSFGELEGFGLPPIEAALSGNVVIGYTGEGGKEYWHQPLFIEINNGDIKSFSKTILSVIDRYAKSSIDFDDLKSHVNQLKNTYSKENERKSLKDLLHFIKAELHQFNKGA